MNSRESYDRSGNTQQQNTIVAHNRRVFSCSSKSHSTLYTVRPICEND